MIDLVDFDNVKIAKGVYYGGDAGAKNAVLYEGEAWMVKYPKTTRALEKPQTSYTTSPLSEHIGSKIYEALDIPVHETMLGMQDGKIVVACKDFTRKWYDELPWGGCGLWLEKLLVPFHDLKNSFMCSGVDLFSGAGSETLLDEVLATINGQDELKSMPGVSERFWDMFVIDAFIGNKDRHNGNWGILVDQRNGDAVLAPVYDNGNAFFNKRSAAQMAKRICNERSMREDAYQNPLCTHKYIGSENEAQQINPYAYIRQCDNQDCNGAVLRFVSKVDMNVIEGIIRCIPEAVGDLAVMPEVQKEFYLEIMRMRLDHVLMPVAQELLRTQSR